MECTESGVCKLQWHCAGCAYRRGAPQQKWCLLEECRVGETRMVILSGVTQTSIQTETKVFWPRGES